MLLSLSDPPEFEQDKFHKLKCVWSWHFTSILDVLATREKNMQFSAPCDGNILDLLVNLFPQSSKNTLRSWLKEGRVQVETTIVKNTNTPILRNAQITLLERKKRIGDNLSIVYEDEDVVVVNKASGLLSVATAFDKTTTVHAILKSYYRTRKIFVVHRLDQDTSGIMVFAFNQHSFEQLKILFEKHDIQRAYTAIVEGMMKQSEGCWQSYQHEDKQYKVHETNDSSVGSLAITHFFTVATSKHYSWMELKLETGRKNQIRVHCAAAGHPVVGDKKYESVRNPIKRLCLHAHLLAFKHPSSKKLMSFTAPIPEEFYKLISPS